MVQHVKFWRGIAKKNFSICIPKHQLYFRVPEFPAHSQQLQPISFIFANKRD